MKRADIVIGTDTITLDRLLKWAGVASTGGMAKMMVKSGRVSVNGVVEIRRTRNLIPGDEVKVGGEAWIRIVREEGPC